MGADANLVCIGYYSDSVKEVLDYSQDWYTNCDKSSLVVSNQLICGTTGKSHDLADAVNVSFYDASTWVVDPEMINWQWLHEGFPSEEVTELAMLIGAGFTIIFQPNC